MYRTTGSATLPALLFADRAWIVFFASPSGHGTAGLAGTAPLRERWLQKRGMRGGCSFVESSRSSADPVPTFATRYMPVGTLTTAAPTLGSLLVHGSLPVQFSTASPDIDEKAIRDPDPRKMCADIARAKARALLESLEKPGILVTADQVRLRREQLCMTRNTVALPL